MNTRSYSKTIGLQPETIFWSFAGILFMLLLMYGYFVQQTIFNVAERARTESSIAKVSSHLGEMESNYLALKRDVTIDRAYALGFKDVSNTLFVARDGAQNLSYNVTH